MQFKDNKAIYLQITDHLMAEILQDVYQEEERMPSVREFAGTAEVNVNTCIRAYDWLQQQDIIYTKRGLGYFVQKGAKKNITKMRRKEFFTDYLPELAHQMKILDISNGELIEELQKIESADK